MVTRVERVDISAFLGLLYIIDVGLYLESPTM